MRLNVLFTKSTLLVAVLLSLPSAWAKKTDSAVLDRLEYILKSGISAPADSKLPARTDIERISRDEIANYLKIAKDFWKQGAENPFFQGYVEAIKNGDTPTQEALDAAGMARKRYKVARFAYIALSENHENPPKLDKVTKIMGHMQDGIKYNRPEMAKTEATKLEPLVKKSNIEKIEAELDALEPSSPKAFRKWLYGALDNIEASMADKNIDEEKFHEVRKDIGRLVTVAELQYAMTPSKETEALVKFLGALNASIGEDHDGMIQEELDGKTAKAAFSQDQRDKLQTLLHFFRNAKGGAEKASLHTDT